MVLLILLIDDRGKKLTLLNVINSEKYNVTKVLVSLLAILLKSSIGMSLHYLGKLEIQIFCRYSADMEENANKLHFKCTDFKFLHACKSSVFSVIGMDNSFHRYC